MLAEYAQIGKKREESILSGVNELVIVTDMSMKLLYINSTAEKTLGLSGNLVFRKNLLDLIDLKDAQGKPASIQSLSVDKALIDKAARVIEGFSIYTKRKLKVLIQIRPITDLNGKVTQIVFVFTDSSGGPENSSHLNLEQAKNKYRAVFDDLQKSLTLTGSKELVSKVELTHKFEEDLLVAYEIEDHSIKEKVSFHDVALLCKQIVVTKQNFAKSLQVPLEFGLPKNEPSEASLISLAESTTTPNLPISDYMVPADTKWLSILIQKIIDICLLLSIGESEPKVKVDLYREGNSAVIIDINARTNQIHDLDRDRLFQENFGELGTTTYLRFGSGLEGFIIKSIKEQLNIPIEIKVANGKTASFIISLSKKAK